MPSLEDCLEQTIYMNIITGDVDTYQNWKADGFDPDTTRCLIEVINIGGEWVAKD
jgi:hypothetical protein